MIDHAALPAAFPPAQVAKGNIRLTKCPHGCGAVADKYVEWEPLAVFIDVVLQKPQARGYSPRIPHSMPMTSVVGGGAGLFSLFSERRIGPPLPRRRVEHSIRRGGGSSPSPELTFARPGSCSLWRRPAAAFVRRLSPDALPLSPRAARRRSPHRSQAWRHVLANRGHGGLARAPGLALVLALAYEVSLRLDSPFLCLTPPRPLPHSRSLSLSFSRPSPPLPSSLSHAHRRLALPTARRCWTP